MMVATVVLLLLFESQYLPTWSSHDRIANRRVHHAGARVSTLLPGLNVATVGKRWVQERIIGDDGVREEEEREDEDGEAAPPLHGGRCTGSDLGTVDI